MDKKLRNIIIIGCIVTFVIVPIATALVLSLTSQKSQETAKTREDTTLPHRSNDALKAAIAAQQPSLVTNGQPSFAIMKVNASQKGWYIVTIREIDDVEGTNPASILLQDTSDGLKVLLGPGTFFPLETTQPLGIPDAVAEELNS